MAPEASKKAVWGWALYDWANSSFATTVMSGFFPLFFKNYWSSGVDPNTSTAGLGLANSLSGLLVAVMAPVLGAIADRGSAKKALLVFFAYWGVLATACLFLVGQGNWAMAAFLYTMGNVGFAGANIFYDALLPDVADEKRIDFVSGLGFAMGYLGGGLLFLVNVLMVLHPEWFGLSSAVQAVRLSFLSVAAWWGGFTLITIAWVPGRPPGMRVPGWRESVRGGLAQLADTFKKIRHLRTVGLFLLAYWLYIDGVDTIIRMSVDYGLSLGFEANSLIVALLLVQFVGFPAALVFGKLGQNWSVRGSIFIAIGAYCAVTVLGMAMTQTWHFYALAMMVGLFQGGIQALSRSYYSRLIPKNQAAEFYGFYNMLGKFAVIVGPTLMGLVGLVARRMLMPEGATPEQMMQVGHTASRLSILSVLVLLLAGGVLLFFVSEQKGKAEAAILERS